MAEQLDDSDPDDYAVAIGQLPSDVGTPVLPPAMRKLRHVVGVALRNLAVDTAPADRRQSIDSADGSFDPDDSLVAPARSSRRRGRQSTPGIQKALVLLNAQRLLDSVFAIYAVDPEEPVSELTTASTASNGSETAKTATATASTESEPETSASQAESGTSADKARQHTSTIAPLYISEVSHRSLNSDFAEIDLALAHRNDTRFVLSVWGRSEDLPRWSHVFSKLIDLSSLVFVGKTPDTISLAFPSNSCIVFLTDGCYILPEVAKLAARANGNDASLALSPAAPHREGTPLRVESCTFETIMTINSLEDCITDWEATKRTVTSKINTALTSNASIYIYSKQRTQLEASLQRIRVHREWEARRKEALNRQISEAKQRLAARRAKLDKELEAREKARDALRSVSTELTRVSQLLAPCKYNISLELGRICSCLQTIFRIERRPEDDAQFAFSICGLDLPEVAAIAAGNYEDNELAAAYGIVCQLVNLLSTYLCVGLRYPIETYGSQSFIVDPISSIQGSRTFPLWTKGTIFYRFEYGVYLLHKDIEQLVNFISQPLVDVRHTLANLKNLLLVLSSPSSSTPSLEAGRAI